MTLSEKWLRLARAKVFDYPADKEDQAGRVIEYLKLRVIRQRRQQARQEPVGPYSGLTRAELRKTGTCETDWY